MAYFSDLSPYTYYTNWPEESNPSTLNIGWLDRRHVHPQGATSEEFAERLWRFCRRHVVQTRGFHNCDLCQEFSHDVVVHWRGDEMLRLGSAEIRVFGLNDIVYAAPNMIYHYVVTHHYCPPIELIQAVLEGPLPDSAEYMARALRCVWREDVHYWWKPEENSGS